MGNVLAYNSGTIHYHTQFGHSDKLSESKGRLSLGCYLTYPILYSVRWSIAFHWVHGIFTTGRNIARFLCQNVKKKLRPKLQADEALSSLDNPLKSKENSTPMS